MSSPLLRAAPAATVLEAADGPQLCVGAVFDSLPPQCGGPRLIGWDWADWTGSFEDVGGVRWGMFAVTGHYAAKAFTFTPETVQPWTDGMFMPEALGPLEMFATPCAAPAGGWRVLDASRTTDRSMDRTLERAAALPGYSTSWVDRSRVPQAGPDATPEEQVAETAPYPELTIINVRVTGELEAATAELRKIWGGMLCVSKGTRTDAELQRVNAELVEAMSEHGQDWHVLGVGVDGLSGTVSLDVVHDDGSLQKQMDAEYGTGIVKVASALQRVG